MTDQTRFKYGLIFCGIVFAQALIKTFFPAFPFSEATLIQGGALGIYTVTKSTTNAIQAKLAARTNGACEPSK